MPDPNILFKNIPSAAPQESFQNALVNYDNFKTMPIKHQLLEQRAAAGDVENQRDKLKFQLFDMANDAMQLKPILESGNIPAAMQALDRRVAKIRERGGDPSDTLGLMQQLQDGDLKGAMSQLEAPISAAQQLGIITDMMPAGMREFNLKTQGMTPEQRKQALLIDTGLAPRASVIKVVDVGGVPTIVDSNANTATPLNIGGRAVSVGDVAGNRAKIAAAESGASEGAKLDQQAVKAPGIAGDVAAAESEAKKSTELKYGPQIASAIRLAEENAKAKGETLTDLARAEAAMPSLNAAVSQLKELAPIATSTIGGKIWDVAVKESGFGATEGLKAKAGFISIVDNQVLPLLRQTFGAAFTAKEGKTLRNAMANPDASPEEKMVQLDSFIAQKRRDIESKKAELKSYGGAGQQENSGKQGGKLMIDANGNKAMVYPDGSYQEVK
jgi:hypothetical protein